MLIKLVAFLSVEVVLSPAFFIATKSDQGGQEGKCRSACSCLCGTSNIPACLSSQQTGTHRSLRLTVPGQSKSLCSCVLFHLCHSLRQSQERGQEYEFCFIFSLHLILQQPEQWALWVVLVSWGTGQKGHHDDQMMELLLCEKSLNK